VVLSKLRKKKDHKYHHNYFSPGKHAVKCPITCSDYDIQLFTRGRNKIHQPQSRELFPQETAHYCMNTKKEFPQLHSLPRNEECSQLLFHVTSSFLKNPPILSIVERPEYLFLRITLYY